MFHSRWLLGILLSLPVQISSQALAGVTDESKPVILVSVYPVLAMVREIAGEAFQVRSALPSGRSEHGFEPSPKEIRGLRSAALLVLVDDAMDAWMVSAAGKQVPAIKVLPATGPLTYGETIGGEAIGTGSPKNLLKEQDPHFWTDPERMGKAALFVASKLSGMVKSDLEQQSVAARAATFAARMSKLKLKISSDAKSWPVSCVILAHGSLGYFARMSGLKIAGLLEPVPHMEPGPRHLRELIVAAKRNKPCVVLAEEQIDAAVARALAREANVPVARINPLGNQREGSGGVSNSSLYIGSYDRYIEGLTVEIGQGLARK